MAKACVFRKNYFLLTLNTTIIAQLSFKVLPSTVIHFVKLELIGRNSPTMHYYAMLHCSKLLPIMLKLCSIVMAHFATKFALL